MTAGRRVALFLPSLHGGGAERVYVELANAFATEGHAVDLVLAKAEGPYLGEVSRAVRIVDLGAPRMMRALPALVRYLRSARPAAFLSGLDHANVAAILACGLAGRSTRCVISVRSVPSAVYRDARSFASRALFGLMKRIYRYADAIVANSEAVAKDVRGLIPLGTGQVHVVYNPLNLARIAGASLEPVAHDWLAAGAPPVVIAVGSLTPLKDFASLIAAFGIVRARRPCRLVILGEGPERASLEAAARERGVARDLLMPGFTPNPFAWMRRASVFVSSSLTEGCPNSLMQALAVGTPVVSTDGVGGSTEILGHGRWGRLVPVGRPDAMAVAIESCLDARPGADTSVRAAEFSHERVARRYLEILLPKEKAT